MGADYVRKPVLKIEKECLHCHKIFHVYKSEGRAAQIWYCSPECKRMEKNRVRVLRRCGEIPPSTRPRKEAEKKIGRFALEVDPWTTGQLPASVTRNALWSQP